MMNRKGGVGIIGWVFTIIITVGMPLSLVIYAVLNRRWIPFFLGVIAFTVSQLLIRIPLLQYIEKNSMDFLFFGSQYPIWYAIVLGLSAALFEEGARYLAMRYLMKQRDWLSGFLFGAGHGGIEAVILVGIPMLSIFPFTADGGMLALAGVERIFAMLLHIGLSIIVLRGVIQKRISYLVAAIVIHASINSMIGILPVFIPQEYVVLSVESILAFVAIGVISYGIYSKREEVW